MNFTGDVVIGLEIHIGLNTQTKLFCSCKNQDADPNTNVCPVCMGHPGSKPIVNKKVIEYALKLCAALNSEISNQVIFSRKSYFYPDLAKNYQITQYELPIGTKGALILPNNKVIGLTRIHIEEDPASLVHVGGVSDSQYSFIDYNRSGTPLLEIVTNPEMSSPKDTKDFLKTLIGVLSYLDIFDVKNGLIKADVNVSIKESGYVRAEIKNINGFKEIQRALDYEISRQKKEVLEGVKLEIETRGWDVEKGQTYSMRKKESEADYGYIIDTDLCPIDIDEKTIVEIKKKLPLLPVEFAEEISKKHDLNFEDVFIIANQKVFAKYYTKALDIDPKLATNWFRHVIPTPFAKKYGDLIFVDSIPGDEILELIKLFYDKKVSDKIAKEILEKLVEEVFSPIQYIKKNGLEMVSNTDELMDLCKEVISTNPQAIQDYKSGEEKSLNFLVGQVMKKSKGKANPGEVRKIIIDLVV